MTDYGLCQKFIGDHRAFKCPPKCPECCRSYPECKNEIHYVSDYVTHRIGYHHALISEVYCNLMAILALENHCCCYSCSKGFSCHSGCNCCDCNCGCNDKVECWGDKWTYGSHVDYPSDKVKVKRTKLRELEDKLENLQEEIANIRRDCD